MHHAVRKRQVTQTARRFVADTWQSEAVLSFFLGLVLVMVFVLPLTNFVMQHFNAYVDICYTLMLGTGVALSRRSGFLFFLTLATAAVTIAVRWACWWYPSLLDLREILSLLNILLLSALLLSQVLAKGYVTSTRIQGAIAVYLLFGLAWAHAFHLVTLGDPHAFVIQTGTPSTATEWVYYSFTTLTTLGYGDIVPVTRISRMLCVLEALTGQLYLAVLIARLVAIQVAETFSSRRQ
jgi:voltage-gated potassium channel Kch